MNAEAKAVLAKYKWYLAPYIAGFIVYIEVWLYFMLAADVTKSVTDAFFFGLMGFIIIVAVLSFIVTEDDGYQYYLTLKREHEGELLRKAYREK